MKFRPLDVQYQHIMKKILLLILLTFAFSNIQAQPGYRPMLHNERKWQIMLANGSICLYTSGYELRIFGDTIINSLHYYKSSQRAIFSFNQVAYCPPYYLDSVEVQQSLFFREDTTTRKVYQYYPPGPEELIYDFSLQAGDTFYFWNNTGYAVLSSISYTFISLTDSTRQFNFIGGAFWTEGYDCSEGAFGVPLVSVSGSYYRTVCIIDSGWVIPPNSFYCVSGFAGLNHHESLASDILQNTIANNNTLLIHPATQPMDDIFLEVMDVQGKLLQHLNVKRDQSEIQLPQLSSGIYFTRFYLKSGESHSYKILVP